MALVMTILEILAVLSAIAALLWLSTFMEGLIETRHVSSLDPVATDIEAEPSASSIRPAA